MSANATLPGTSRLLPIMLAAMLVAGCSARDNPGHATLVITDARIWTGDQEMPWAEAIASQDETILAVGRIEDIAPLIGQNTEIISIPGSMVVPGFIDAHVHFIDGGNGLASVQLRDAATPEEFTSRIAEHAADLEPGEWLLHGTWDHQNWGGELPIRDWIDAVTPDNPVWVNRLDGHMGVANSLALKLAGVDVDTPDVDGGEIVRDEAGRPTGVLKDNAMMLMNDAIPPASTAQLERAAKAAMYYVARNGVTSVHDMADRTSLATYRRLERKDELSTRIYSVLPLSEWQQLVKELAQNGKGDRWLKIGGLKGFMDGSLGSHTAAFLEPFTDAPEESGFLVNELSDMRTWIHDADAAGLQVMVHAIGDRAIRDLLDIYFDVQDDNGTRDRRFRIEHAQHIHPQDLQRFAVQGVIASMQPYHAIDDGRWAEEVIGPERARTTYAFRSLIDQDTHVAFGSDWYVAPATPLEGIYAAVTRRTLDDMHPDGWIVEQKISVEQALRAYTFEAAYAAFDENIKGTLKTGMLADFVLLDKDITAIPPEEIRDVKVLRTIVGGRVVYKAD